MIKTKFVLLFFSVLAIILFPFSFILSENIFFTSIAPGWDTSFSNGYLLATFIKFILLLLAISGYWILSKNNPAVSRTLVGTHLLTTIPSVINAKFSLLNLVDFESGNMEKINNSIEFFVVIIVCLNVLFLSGQIYFWFHFFKIRKTYRLHFS
ncbi:hypothetical protein NAT51_04610 [Flavobacterium amniphilum]|uniref:hypothetical protein n=1 Tax=Flavobacterium amniphilum TaxID=1834035 RepID=UPI002029D56B|nr:hypothetical protein [Flavobacterium amniphilum]MCL9804789.1 hypothetical protein [Flavobacterium amniphilum]